jgi:MoaA/NifB/PqqE/SkfB family radical SAM enzyme
MAQQWTGWGEFRPLIFRLDHLFQSLPPAPEPAAALPQKQPEPIRQEPLQSQVADPLLDPAMITDIRIDLTSRCNLRCVYCAVSQPDYVGEDMPDDVVRSATTAVFQLSRYHEISGVGVNGHGETTFRPGWTKPCREIIALGLPVNIITNLAKPYSTEELNVLGSLHTISISIDTADRDLLRRIRRRVDVRQIITNITAIRAAALRRNRPTPNFQFFCGLYDQNTLQIEELAWLAVALDIQRVQFWDLFAHSYEGLDISEEDRVYPLASLTDEELRPRLEAVIGAIAILRRATIAVEIDGPFITELCRRVGLHV